MDYTQKLNYAKSVEIMSNREIRKAWETFFGDLKNVEYFD